MTIAVTESDPPIELPEFREALRPYAADLPVNTYWRYANGHLPKALRFLAEHPDLAEAFAKAVRRRTERSATA